MQLALANCGALLELTTVDTRLPGQLVHDHEADTAEVVRDRNGQLRLTGSRRAQGARAGGNESVTLCLCGSASGQHAPAPVSAASYMGTTPHPAVAAIPHPSRDLLAPTIREHRQPALTDS